MRRAASGAGAWLAFVGLGLACVAVSVVAAGAPASAPAPPPCPDPAITVRKAARALDLTCRGRPRARFGVSLGRAPKGPKQREGDGRTPEGSYYVCTRNDRSAFHLFLGLAYPGPADAERGQRDRLVTPAQVRAIREAHAQRGAPPWNTRLGGAVGIHGAKNGWGFVGRLHLLFDWTNGCIAVADREIEELWGLVPLGTPVTIAP